MAKFVRWFQDPIDGTRFKNRDDCFQHMVKNDHNGAPMMIEEKQEEKKKKVSKVASFVRGIGSRGKGKARPFHCMHTKCVYQGKTKDDLDKHQKALKHKGYKKVNDAGTILSQGPTGVSKKPDEAQKPDKAKKPDKAEKPKDTRSAVQKELEDSFEENYGRPYDVFIRITEESYTLIKKVIPKGIEYHNQTGNHLIYIPKGKYREFDYLMFYYDFVEIEMEIKDVIYAMSFFEASEGEEENKLISWDIAEYREMNIVAISDIGGCFVVHHTKTSDKLPVADAIKELTAYKNHSKLACVGGMWQYVYTRPPDKVTKDTAKKGVSNNKSRGSSRRDRRDRRHEGHHGHQTSLVHYQHGAEEYRAELIKESEQAGMYGHGSWNSAPAKSSYPREPKWHPVYGIAKGIVIIDRLIDYLEVYYPDNK